MESLNFVYPKAQEVALVSEPVAAPGEGEVLVETTKTLISVGTEMTCLRGVFDEGSNWHAWVKYPFYPGYSCAGRVVQAGAGVTGLQAGDRVWTEHSHSQLYTLPAADAHRIPEGVSDEQATWVPLLRVAQNIVRKCEVKMGDSVVVVGLGQVGQLVVQFARLCGATTIIVVDSLAYRCEKAMESGVTHTITGAAQNAHGQVKECTDGRMADIVIDATGHPAVLAAACTLVRSYGKIGLVGDTSTPSAQALGPGVVSRYLTILGAHGSMTPPCDNDFYPWTYARTNAVSLQYIQQGRLKLDHLVTRVCSPLEAPAVYQEVFHNSGSFLGVMFNWCALAQ